MLWNSSTSIIQLVDSPLDFTYDIQFMQVQVTLLKPYKFQKKVVRCFSVTHDIQTLGHPVTPRTTMTLRLIDLQYEKMSNKKESYNIVRLEHWVFIYFPINFHLHFLSYLLTTYSGIFVNTFINISHVTSLRYSLLCLPLPCLRTIVFTLLYLDKPSHCLI